MRPLILLFALLPVLSSRLLATDDPPAPAKVFAKTCGPCHGKDGRGAPHLAKMLGAAPTDLSQASVQARSDAELAKIVTEGAGKMPAFGSRLEPAQLEAIMKFMRSLGAPPADAPAPGGGAVAPAPESGVSLGASIFKVSCVKCHGPEGRGRPELAKALDLEAARIDLRDPATRSKARSRLRETIREGHLRMPGFSGRLAEAEIEALLDHLQEPQPAAAPVPSPGPDR